MSYPVREEVSSNFEVRFQSLFHEGRALSFPCDEQGHVDLDSLSPAAKSNYFYARALVGRDFDMPTVRLRDVH